MTDLRLAVGDGIGKLDLVVEEGDLALDDSFATPALASLFTDSLAHAEDELPGGTERRGWWAEAILPGEETEAWGCRLWLLERAKLTNDTLGSAEVYAREGLRWLVDRGIVDRVDVAASRLDGSTLFLEVVLVHGEATERAELWEGTTELDLPVGPARVSILAVP